jgi:hypothetical protein
MQSCLPSHEMEWIFLVKTGQQQDRLLNKTKDGWGKEQPFQTW